MKIISKGEGVQRLSKQKTELQLPKINKNASLEGASYQIRYQWVNRSSEYVLLSNHAVQQQHTYLLQELSALQSQLTRMSEPADSRVSKPLRKSHQTNIIQNRQRQIQNNNAIIWKLRNQLQLLVRHAGASSKQNIQVTLLQTKEKIVKTKQKIKEIKQKSREMEGSFENGHDIYEEMEKLEHQRNGYELKREKIQEKMAISINNLERLEAKLQQIQDQFQSAEKFLEEYHSTEKTEAQGKQMEGVHRQKMYQMQVTRKMIQSQRSVKQQKCHQLLKTLQTQVEKLQLLQRKFQSLQMKNLYQKKEILQLEDQLMIQQESAREQARTSGSLQPRYHKVDTNSQTNDFKGQKLKIELGQVKNHRFRPQLEKDNASRMLYSSRTKTSGDYKVNRTELMIKPPSSENENEMTRMISQALPANRAYFRSNKTKNQVHSDSSESTFKTLAFAENKPKEVPIQIHHQEIMEQSPEKETIDKPSLQDKPKEVKIEMKEKTEVLPENAQTGEQVEKLPQEINNLIADQIQEKCDADEQKKIEVQQNKSKAIQSIADYVKPQPIVAQTKKQQPNTKSPKFLQQKAFDSKATNEELALKQKRNIIESYLNKFDDQQEDNEEQQK